MKAFVGVLLVIAFCTVKIKALEVIYDWTVMNYQFPPDFNISFFRPENTIVTGIEIIPDRVFVATPRLRPGVPAVLSWFPRSNRPGREIPMEPYPDWSYHSAGQEDYNCSGLISVYRTRIDSCNRLWVLDAGTVNSLADFRRVCSPKILVFDLRTNVLVRSIVFPEDVLRPHSVLTNLVLDESIQGKCDASFVYISDSVAAGLIVLDGARDGTWRFSDPSFFPNPDNSQMSINNEQFSLMDGIIGLALSPQLGRLYYQPLASDRIFVVNTRDLVKGPPGEFDAFPLQTAGRKSSQAMPLAINEVDNSLFFCPFTEASVASWNTVTNRQRILATDNSALQFVADLKWYNDGYLYLVSSRFHKFFLRTLDQSDINVRIIRIPLKTVGRTNYFPFPNFQYL